jgi:AmmeMemoRadiSam system protein A
MPLSPEERSQLAALARATVEAAVRGKALPATREARGVLAESRGCFVTLTNAGRLRGCIGTFQPSGPLGELLPQIAAAATQDGRFLGDPVTPAELEHLDIEVSILSPLEPMERLEDLEIGTHGVYVVRGGRSGCFLPEVATDQGWDARQFLDECCAGKAGLPPDAWRQPDTRVFLFTSEKFGT